MIRFALIFLVALGAFVLLRVLLAKKKVSVRQFGLVYVSALAGMVLVYLGITGRLPWLFGVAGAVLPFVVRSLPLLLRFVDLRTLAQRFRQYRSGGSIPPGQTSSLNTRYFAMTLDHDSGVMDGTILLGINAGKRLSDLDLETLRDVLTECQSDPDSIGVLRAYLDRTFPHWQQGEQADTNHYAASGNLSISEAYEVLGIPPDSDRETVRYAHRRLIGKVHPDRGGSDYLAARINEAKAVLLAHLDR